MSNVEPEKPRWNPMLVVPLAVAALGLAIYMGYRALAPPAMDVPAQTADSQWMREIAKRTQGDMSKLTPAEQERLQKITNGQGQRALTFMVNPRSEFPQFQPPR